MQDKKLKGIRTSLLIIFFFVINFTVFPYKVEAVREVCTSKVLSEQKNKAHNIKFEYELKYDEYGSYYYEVSFTNIKEGIEFTYGGVTYKYLEQTPVQTLIPMFEGGTTLELEMFVAYGYPCVGEEIGTKKIKLPKYNKYSEYNECIEYEEFVLCGKNYEGDIPNPQYFYDKLEEYKLLINTDKPIDKKEKSKTVIEKLVDLYINNLIITLPITIIIVGLVSHYIIKKIINKKQRVKVKI